MFTLQSSFAQLMSHEIVRRGVEQFFPPFILSLVRPDQQGMTLSELKEAVRLPWGAGFPSEDVLTAANFAIELAQGETWERIPLWPGDEQVYLIAPARKTCQGGCSKPAAIICPGGAYSSLAMPSEGIAYAETLREKGYVPFVLSYSIAPRHYPRPHEDMALAVKYVRKNAAVYGLDPENLMLIGSSAGGHLVSSFAASPDEYEALLMDALEKQGHPQAAEYRGIYLRPQKLTLAYPAISFMDLPLDDPCYFALTGGDPALKEKLSVETQVKADFPRCFLWACEDDVLVPVSDHALRLDKALTAVHAQHKCRIYPTGGHGCGLGAGTSADGWLDVMLDYMKN